EQDNGTGFQSDSPFFAVLILVHPNNYTLPPIYLQLFEKSTSLRVNLPGGPQAPTTAKHQRHDLSIGKKQE
ncbi:MAG TPA: hypothetical protein PLL81_09005, partial [Bacillota bacterium]|nr:hypothetical protein [Bacillota bacterium]